MAEIVGCWRAAERADGIVAALLRLRLAVDVEAAQDISELVRRMQVSSRVLMDLYDLAPVYRDRIPLVIDYLGILLPCFMRTLEDIRQYLSQADLVSYQRIWIMIFDHLLEEGGVSPAERFRTYNDFIIQLVRRLSRPDLFSATVLETLRVRIIGFRLRRGYPVPRAPTTPAVVFVQPEVGPDLLPLIAVSDTPQRPHWAEDIFDDRHPASRLRHRLISRCFGRPMPDYALAIPADSKVLFKLAFTRSRLSVSACLLPYPPDTVRLLCRYVDSSGLPARSSYGVQELVVSRRGASLQFRRLSLNLMRPKIWLAMFFKNWEKMVLFHHTFVALKIRCPLTVACSPDDFILGGERNLFQDRILDDGFDHVLVVYSDQSTGGVRLRATIGDGELARTPVWTAFVTDVMTSPRWLQRHSPKRIWLRECELYVFCDAYNVQNQRRSRGAFELSFREEGAADRFEDVFRVLARGARN